MRFEQHTLLTDCLTNGCRDNVLGNYGQEELPATMYARGIVNGMISVLMAAGMEFREALKVVHKYAPSGNGPHGPFSSDSIPRAFLSEWDSIRMESL